MDMRCCGAVVLIWSVVVPCAVRAQQQQPSQQQQQREICRSAIPANVDAGQLTGEMLTLLGRSDSFRAQCARIAAAPRVRLTLSVVNTLDSGRAQTVMHRYQAGALRADVDLLFGENYRELLAHEFEHVLEQMDGVDLRDEAAHGRAWLLPGGAFETRRAFTRGVEVLRESEGSRRHAAIAVTGMR